MPRSVTKEWFVYMLRCGDNSLYTGITTNIQRRLTEHNSHKGGAKYTKARQPVCVVYSEKVTNRSEAARREWELKQLPRADKERLFGA